jgi:lysozyme family protein
MVDMAALKAENAKRWAVAKLTRNFVATAKSLTSQAAKDRYVTVQNYTGVPWWFIAIIHEREASQSWTGSLAQGDPWNKVSVHEPRGRGPFQSWEAAAIDALTQCSPYAARNKDWTVGETLTLWEEYNGLGYAARSLPSPYVWSGTDQYVSGKFVRDDVFDPDVIDLQPGCAGLVMTMMNMDPSIKFGSNVIPIGVASGTQPDVVESPSTFMSAVMAIVHSVSSILRGK